jgi:hypothetical protein
MRWIQGFINPGTLYLPRPDGLINPGIHRIESHQLFYYMTHFICCFYP